MITRLLENILILIVSAILTPFMAVIVALFIVPSQTHRSVSQLWEGRKRRRRGF